MKNIITLVASLVLCACSAAQTDQPAKPDLAEARTVPASSTCPPGHCEAYYAKCLEDGTALAVCQQGLDECRKGCGEDLKTSNLGSSSNEDKKN